MTEELPPDERRPYYEPFSPNRRQVDQLVIEGLAEAVRTARIEKEFGEELIKAYKETTPQEESP